LKRNCSSRHSLQRRGEKQKKDFQSTASYTFSQASSNQKGPTPRHTQKYGSSGRDTVVKEPVHSNLTLPMLTNKKVHQTEKLIGEKKLGTF